MVAQVIRAAVIALPLLLTRPLDGPCLFPHITDYSTGGRYGRSGLTGAFLGGIQ